MIVEMEDSIALEVECPDCQAEAGEACIDDWAAEEISGERKRMKRHSAHQNRYFVQAGGVIEPRVVREPHWSDSIDAALDELVMTVDELSVSSDGNHEELERKIEEIKDWVKREAEGTDDR